MLNTRELLKILVCPKCHGELSIAGGSEKPAGFECPACGLIYPIRDEIPIMLVEQAIPLAQWQQNSGD